MKGWSLTLWGRHPESTCAPEWSLGSNGIFTDVKLQNTESKKGSAHFEASTIHNPHVCQLPECLTAVRM